MLVYSFANDRTVSRYTQLACCVLLRAALRAVLSAAAPVLLLLLFYCAYRFDPSPDLHIGYLYV